jgi:hypothetical protein
MYKILRFSFKKEDEIEFIEKYFNMCEKYQIVAQSHSESSNGTITIIYTCKIK